MPLVTFKTIASFFRINMTKKLALLVDERA
jgi:hypothetical protein